MTRSQAERLIGHKELRHGPTPKGGSSEEFSAMGESLTEQRRVRDEVSRDVNLCWVGRRSDGTT